MLIWVRFAYLINEFATVGKRCVDMHVVNRDANEGRLFLECGKDKISDSPVHDFAGKRLLAVPCCSGLELLVPTLLRRRRYDNLETVAFVPKWVDELRE